MQNIRLAIKILIGTVGIIIFPGLAMILFVRTDVHAVWIIIVVLAVGVGFAAALSSAITRPVNELVEAARAVERGDLSVRV